jgi:ubiquinone/menaquinone biosynthesis C-methylase UbiE
MTDEKICQAIFSKLKGNENLLDVGCGEGYLCNCLAQKLQKPVVGLDISNKGFDKAHKLCQKFNTCGLVECLHGKAENLKKVVRNKKFDVITCVHSCHHMGDVRQALKQSKKVLRERGKFIIAEYSPERGKREDNCKRFSIKFIIDLLIKNNFTDINISQPERGFFLLVAQ